MQKQKCLELVRKKLCNSRGFNLIVRNISLVEIFACPKGFESHFRMKKSKFWDGTFECVISLSPSCSSCIYFQNPF